MAKKITELTELTYDNCVGNDVLPIVDVSASATRKITASGLFMSRIYTVKATADSVVNPDPAGYTLVDSLTITLPSLPATTTAIVIFDVGKIGTHPSRYSIYVDDTDVSIPSGSYMWYDLSTGEGNGRHITVMTTISLSSGSHHVEVREAAALDTSSVTFKDRTLAIILL